MYSDFWVNYTIISLLLPIEIIFEGRVKNILVRRKVENRPKNATQGEILRFSRLAFGDPFMATKMALRDRRNFYVSYVPANCFPEEIWS